MHVIDRRNTMIITGRFRLASAYFVSVQHAARIFSLYFLAARRAISLHEWRHSILVRRRCRPQYNTMTSWHLPRRFTPCVQDVRSARRHRQAQIPRRSSTCMASPKRQVARFIAGYCHRRRAQTFFARGLLRTGSKSNSPPAATRQQGGGSSECRAARHAPPRKKRMPPAYAVIHITRMTAAAGLSSYLYYIGDAPPGTRGQFCLAARQERSFASFQAAMPDFARTIDTELSRLSSGSRRHDKVFRYCDDFCARGC